MLKAKRAEMLARPMRPSDIAAAYESVAMSFASGPEERERVLGRSDEEVEESHERSRSFLRTDPEGAWVAEDKGAIVGVAASIRRESLWILSIFAVDEARRGKGVGRELLDRAMEYGEGCEAAMIASSTHPAAMRSYALAGFTLHPTFTAEGLVRRGNIPPSLPVHEGDESHLEMVAEVDRKLRGGAHGPDIERLLDTGNRLLVSERGGEMGYAVAKEGSPQIVAATHEEMARDLLWAALADGRPGVEATARWITARQKWAVDVALEAGLSLKPDGPICIEGDPDPFIHISRAARICEWCEMNEAAYDEIADWYDQSLNSGPISLFHELAIPTVLDLAGDIEGLAICDLACGQGIVARRLANRGANVVGIDFSAKLLDIARRREHPEPRGISYIQDDAQKLDTVADGAFDGVVCNLALMDIPDLSAVFRAVHRVLKSRGWFILSIVHPCFLTPGSPRWIHEGDGIVGMEVRDYFEEGHWRKDAPEGVRGRVGSHHRTISSYLNTLSNAGLQIEQCEEPRATGEIADLLPGYAEVPGVLVVRCKKQRDDNQ